MTDLTPYSIEELEAIRKNIDLCMTYNVSIEVFDENGERKGNKALSQSKRTRLVAYSAEISVMIRRLNTIKYNPAA